MREVGAVEAKNRLDALLDWVANGEEVLITRHGKAVARLVPAAPTFDRALCGEVSVIGDDDRRWLQGPPEGGLGAQAQEQCQP